MAIKIGDLFWKIKGDTKDIDGKLKDTDGKVGGLQKTFGGLASFLKGAFVVAAVAGIGKVTKELINAASDAEETRNKFQVTFRDISGAAETAATNLSRDFGLSRTAAEDLLGATGDLLSGFGFTQTAALDLANQTNTLAADLASFANVPVKQASDAITKGLLGEREAMKSLGIAITEADIKQLAEDKGITGELDRQQKAMLTLELATTQSKNAIGDFSRSQDSFANQSKIAQAAVEDLKVELGKNLLPIATQSVSIFGDLARKLADFVEERNRLAITKGVLAGELTDSESLSIAIEETTEKINEQKAALDALTNSGERTRGNTGARVRQRELEVAQIQAQIDSLEGLLQKQKDEADRIANLSAEEAAREAQRKIDEAARLEDIRIRDEAFAKTKEGRIAAIQEEIALFSTYKESDEKAQIVLAELREELAGLQEDSQEAAEEYIDTGQALIGQALVPMTDAEKELWRSYGQGVSDSIQATKKLEDELINWEKIATDALESTFQGFSDIGAALYAGELSFESFGIVAMKALAGVLRSIGAQLAGLAAVNTVAALMGDVTKIPAAVAAGVGAAAAYTAAGVIDAAASSMGTPTPAPAADIPDPAADTSDGGGTGSPRSSGGGGGNTYNISINNLISTGKESELREAVRAQAPYMVEELVRRGDL